MIKSTSKIPQHLQVASILKRRISKGVYSPGTKLPTVRRLGANLGVSTNVIHRALRTLERDHVVEARHGVGVQVLSKEQTRRAPLTFGLVYPYEPDSRFAGSIHGFAEKAIDLHENHCITVSSADDPQQERRVVEQLLDNAVEGLLVWPCSGDENTEFFLRLASRTPMVFVDRTLEGLSVPGVVLDWAEAGRDIVLHLGRQGHRRILVLEDLLKISSFRELYSAMRQAVADSSAADRFDFVPMDLTRCVSQYSAAPHEVVREYSQQLSQHLHNGGYDAIFAPQDEFLDWVYASTPLGREFPLREVVSTTNTRPTPRSLAFYDLRPLEWVADFELMIRKATEILHDLVYLNSRMQREVRILFTSQTRTSDRWLETEPSKK